MWNSIYAPNKSLEVGINYAHLTVGEGPRDGHPCYMFIIVHGKGGNGDQLSQP